MSGYQQFDPVLAIGAKALIGVWIRNKGLDDLRQRLTTEAQQGLAVRSMFEWVAGVGVGVG